MKFITDHLSAINNVAIYPLFSLSIFVTFFVVLGWWVLKADKKYISKMAKLPLEN